MTEILEAVEVEGAPSWMREAVRSIQQPSGTAPRFIMVDGIMYDMENLTPEQADVLADVFIEQQEKT